MKGIIQALPIPNPYQAMFTLCSDLDETPDWQTYGAICRFLNTTDESAMGRGLGLEIGNTIYFDMPDEQFAYWNTNSQGREMIHRLIRSGHIDAYHSFGDLCEHRSQAQRNIEALQQANCELKVWIDHAQAVSNFGADIMLGQGDLPDADVYHADLSIGAGIDYVWTGRVTSIIGQNAPRSYRGLIDRKHIAGSLKTVLKEFAKAMTSRLGKPKYDMHVNNQVLRKTVLRDNQVCYEFLRADPHWAGVGAQDSSLGLATSINSRYLDTLCARQGISIHYTHLGKIEDRLQPFTPAVLKSLRLLTKYANEQKLLITTTRRILDYCRMLHEAEFHASSADNHCRIDAINAPQDLVYDGVSFELPQNCDSASLHIANGTVIELAIDKSSQHAIASAAWPRLEFPDLPGEQNDPREYA